MRTPAKENLESGKAFAPEKRGIVPPAAESIRRQVRILVVDDDIDTRESLCMLLEMRGHLPSQAGDGIEGLSKFAEGKFDLVISDYHMLGMNGLDMVRKIKQIRPDIPVIMASGAAQPEERRVMIEAGASAVLMKPYELDALDSEIEKALEKME